ncbi:MlaD family protein [Nocardia sp. NPDC058058]|uniref:MlaD family protein n=1 Tax=Nocardia sp. NPDC058058 TaxID=3346317 RepID=UPI0036D8E78E
MKSVTGAAWRTLAFAVAMIVVLGVVISAIKRPVDGATETHAVLFTDANGLKTGDDVRMYGVQVGKVNSIALEGNRAKVQISVLASRPLYDTSKLAIRYQNLTGQRYIDVQQPPAPTNRLAAGVTIGTDRTIPSFDITALFNGLQPVLATLSPDALNQFAENMLAVIEGDGTRVGSALDSIGKLSSYVTNRQTVISTLVGNLAHISDQIGGQSPHLVTLLRSISDVFGSLQTNIDGLVDFALTAPPLLNPVDSLLDRLGLTPKANPDIDGLIRTLFPNPQDAVDVLGRLPGLLQSLDALVPPTGSAVELSCSRGNAEVPQVFSVLIAGQKVAICKQ